MSSPTPLSTRMTPLVFQTAAKFFQTAAKAAYPSVEMTTEIIWSTSKEEQLSEQTLRGKRASQPAPKFLEDVVEENYQPEKWES